jgi:hypothetical protein
MLVLALALSACAPIRQSWNCKTHSSEIGGLVECDSQTED